MAYTKSSFRRPAATHTTLVLVIMIYDLLFPIGFPPQDENTYLHEVSESRTQTFEVFQSGRRH